MWEPSGYYPCDHAGSFARMMWRGTFLYAPEARGVRGRLWWLDESFDASEFPDDEQLVHIRPVLYLDDRHERRRRGGDVYDLMLGDPVLYSPAGLWVVDHLVTEVPRAELLVQGAKE